MYIGRTGAEAEVPSQLIRKDFDARKEFRQKKGMTEDEMVRWQHQLNRT